MVLVPEMFHRRHFPRQVKPLSIAVKPFGKGSRNPERIFNSGLKNGRVAEMGNGCSPAY
jgi:hypothetical protein